MPDEVLLELRRQRNTDMGDMFSGLKLEHWWHAFTVVGGAGLVAATAATIKGLPQRDAILLCLGLFLFGIGQWINHPVEERVNPMLQLKITAYHRRPGKLGRTLEAVAVVLFSVAVVRLATGQ